MQPSQRVIIATPMRELWDDRGTVTASRARDLAIEDIRELLRRGPLRFIVAEVGSRLLWLPEEECFTFWKSQVQSHLAAPSMPAVLDEFPGGYCYFASEWTPEAGTPIVLLEVLH